MKTNDEIRLDRLKLLIDESGGVSKFAERIGKQYAQVSQWVNQSIDSKTGKRRSMNDNTVRNIEQLCNKPRGWMDQPAETIAYTSTEDYIPIRTGNLRSANYDPTQCNIPLISWVQAGNWCEAIDLYHCGDAEKWLSCPARHSDKTFALRVQGLSMYNPDPSSEHSFKDGEIIYVDPCREPMNKSFVVARLQDENRVTFKQLIIDNDHKYLRPINPDWPETIIKLTDRAVICGVVIYKGMEI